MGKSQNTRKNHIQESQEVSPFPAGDHKAAMNRQESIKNTKQKHRRRFHLAVTHLRFKIVHIQWKSPNIHGDIVFRTISLGPLLKVSIRSPWEQILCCKRSPHFEKERNL